LAREERLYLQPGVLVDHLADDAQHVERLVLVGRDDVLDALSARAGRALVVQCILAPPISSSVTFSPMTISAIRGLPRYMLALPSTITTTSQNAGMYAPPAALGPKSRHTWGTCPLICTWL